MLKEIAYTALGAVKIVEENVKRELENLQKNGKLRDKDVKSFLKNLERQGKIEDKRVKKEIKKSIKGIIQEFGIVTKKNLKKFKEELKETKENEIKE